ncbi:hypothetical protein JVU11DRAFT_11678 [Chiua virens]|nr:hypothetical protein JVU11DRAFT_11678 [Chiua virens]
MMATEAIQGGKKDGSIADIFTTLDPNATIAQLPARFSAVKKHVLDDMGVTPDVIEVAWKGVLKALEPRVQEIISHGANIIPRIPYQEIEAGLSESRKDAIRKTGVVVITGGVPKDEALKWKSDIKDYIATNPVKGFPAENIQVYELYNTKPQIYARTHDALLNTQKSLLSLWHSSSSFPDSIDFTTPVSYFDRLRIRTPGDRSFTLGPHIDGGSVERWEDTAFRRVWANILRGGQSGWETFDPFDATWRVNARQDMYDAAAVSPQEGRHKAVSLAVEDWELNLDGVEFPGSIPGKAQELNNSTHPHLRLTETMLTIPKIEPGDQVYWHCDSVHAVENEHKGQQDSSVLYIPAVPLCVKNVLYLHNQRSNFVRGLPAPDFPGGEGESKFSGRATPQDITTQQGRRALGFEAFVATSAANTALVDEANKILFG